jgi:Ca2+-binding EF-hand superfamily protein
MKTYLMGGIALAAVVGATAALAQTAQPAPAAPAPQHAPRSHFGKPEARADVAQHVQRMFARLDTNRDGYITKDELAAMEAQFQAKMQQRAATRGQDRSNAFDRIDTNHDGVISREEFAAAPRPEGFGMRRAAFHHGFGERMFDQADANHDGRVSLAEAQALALKHFDEADLNHDGVLTPDERRQAHQMMRGERRPN